MEKLLQTTAFVAFSASFGCWLLGGSEVDEKNSRPSNLKIRTSTYWK